MTRIFFSFVFGYFLFHSMAVAEPTPHPITGKYYEEVKDSATWDEARVESRALTAGGVFGHLITISDRTENLIVKDLGGTSERWIGLTDSTATSLIDGFDLSSLGTAELGNTSSLPLPSPGITPTTGQRGAGFAWVNGDSYDYLNWRPGAPGNFLDQADGVHTIVQGVWQDTAAGVSLGQPGLAGPVLRKYVVEYETVLESEQLHIVERKPSTALSNAIVPTIDVAETLMNLPAGDSDIVQEDRGEVFTISLYDPELGGGFFDYVRAPFISDVPDVNDQHFAFRLNGQVEIPTPGEWTFAMVTANRTKLTIDDNSVDTRGTLPGGPAVFAHSSETDTVLSPITGGSGDVFYFPREGIYELELTSFDSGFWSYVQLFAAPGIHTEFDADEFHLVGDTINGGIAIVAVGDFEDNGILTTKDIDLLACAIVDGLTDEIYDLNDDGSVTQADHTFWVKSLKHTWVGDSNLDGLFDSSDLIAAFQGGKYQSGEEANWEAGDWNGDKRFDTTDLIAAFQDGGYQAGTIYGTTVESVPEPTSVLPILAGLFCLFGYRRDLPTKSIS